MIACTSPERDLEVDAAQDLERQSIDARSPEIFSVLTHVLTGSSRITSSPSTRTA